MARKQESSPAPVSGNPVEPSPAIGPDGYPIGPDGWQEAVITWIPDPPAESNKTWLARALAKIPQMEGESLKAYSRRLFGLAGGRFKSAQFIETCIHGTSPHRKTETKTLSY